MNEASQQANNQTLQPHQQRVVDEKRDLDEKIAKLGAFRSGELFQSLSSHEQTHLNRQHVVMQEYSNILGDRIAAWKE